MTVPSVLPEGTILIEIRGVYDGWSAAKLPDGSMINRWEPGDFRYQATQEWIEAYHIGNEG